MFTSGVTAALIKNAFPELVGIVVSQDAPKSTELSVGMDDLSDVSLVELEPDHADEPGIRKSRENQLSSGEGQEVAC